MYPFCCSPKMRLNFSKEPHWNLVLFILHYNTTTISYDNILSDAPRPTAVFPHARSADHPHVRLRVSALTKYTRIIYACFALVIPNNKPNNKHLAVHSCDVSAKSPSTARKVVSHRPIPPSGL